MNACVSHCVTSSGCSSHTNAGSSVITDGGDVTNHGAKHHGHIFRKPSSGKSHFRSTNQRTLQWIDVRDSE